MDQETVRRICEVGPVYTSLHELITAIVGDPRCASAILDAYPTVIELAGAPVPELQNIAGVGRATAARFKAAFELGRRLSISSAPDRTIVRSPRDAAQLLMGEMGLLEQEELRVLMLDTRGGVTHTHTVYKGSLNASILRAADVFREPVRRNAAQIVMAHNHPSGDPTPSPEDVAATREIICAGELLDISVLDHIVIGKQRFVSMKERGLAF